MHAWMAAFPIDLHGMGVAAHGMDQDHPTGGIACYSMILTGTVVPMT
jgi:hypothetical protein